MHFNILGWSSIDFSCWKPDKSCKVSSINSSNSRSWESSLQVNLKIIYPSLFPVITAFRLCGTDYFPLTGLCSIVLVVVTLRCSKTSNLTTFFWKFGTMAVAVKGLVRPKLKIFNIVSSFLFLELWRKKETHQNMALFSTPHLLAGLAQRTRDVFLDT